MIDVVHRYPVNQGRVADLPPLGNIVEPSGRKGCDSLAKRGCSSSRNVTKSLQFEVEIEAGSANQLLPLSTNDPRFSSRSRRRTTYFQYAA